MTSDGWLNGWLDLCGWTCLKVRSCFSDAPALSHNNTLVGLYWVGTGPIAFALVFMLPNTIEAKPKFITVVLVAIWVTVVLTVRRISRSLSASCPRISVLTCTSVGRATGNDTPPADQLLPHSSCCDMTVYELPLENEQ